MTELELVLPNLLVLVRYPNLFIACLFFPRGRGSRMIFLVCRGASAVLRLLFSSHQPCFGRQIWAASCLLNTMDEAGFGRHMPTAIHRLPAIYEFSAMQLRYWQWLRTTTKTTNCLYVSADNSLFHCQNSGPMRPCIRYFFN